MFFFQLPWLPERTNRLLRRTYFDMRSDARPGAFTEGDMVLYEKAHQGIKTRSAMINFYRAALRRSPWEIRKCLNPLKAETLVICGEKDRYISKGLSVPSGQDVSRLKAIHYIPDASHWVQQDAPEAVSTALVRFFTEP